MQKAFESHIPSFEELQALELRGRELRREYIRELVHGGIAATKRAWRRPSASGRAAIEQG